MAETGDPETGQAVAGRYKRPFAMPRTILALIAREMATTHGRSPGGYLWAILDPVGGIALLSLAFSFAIHTPLLGTNFAYFYASGYLMITVYNDVGNKCMHAIRFSRPLLAYPAVTYVDAIFARLLLVLFTQALVVVIVLTGIDLFFDLPPIPRPDHVVIAFVMAASLGLGVGTLNCLLMGMFPIWERIWSVLNRPFFLLSGVIFTYESLGPQLQAYFWWNPMIHVIGMMRSGMYDFYDPHYVSFAYVFGIALTFFVVGILFLNRYQRDIISGR